MLRVLSLRRATGACAEHHSADGLAELHIRTPAEEAATEILTTGRSLVLTGSPGDGKTHLLGILAPRLPSGIRVVRDANEITRDELIEALECAYYGKARLALAVNRGVLLDACEHEVGRRPWASLLAGGVTEPFVLDGVDAMLGNLAVLDLSLRDNLLPVTIIQALRKLAGIALSEQPAHERLAENARALLDPQVSDRVVSLLRAVADAGHRATMRDLLAFVAHMLAGGSRGRVAKYHANAFAGGQGAFFDRVRDLDPLRIPSPFLDERLYSAADIAEEWLRPDPDDRRASEELEAFAAAKRRALFEHRDGGLLIHRPVPDALTHLISAADPARAVVCILNRFFDPSCCRDDRLVLWMGHRFDARPPAHLASDRFVPITDLEVVVPQLPPHLVAAFGERAPDRLVLRLRHAPEAARLTVGRDLARALEPGGAVAGDQGALMKVGAFFDRLAAFVLPGNAVRMLRLRDSASEIVRVDVDGRRYLARQEEV